MGRGGTRQLTRRPFSTAVTTLWRLAVEHQLPAAVFAVLAVLAVVNEHAELDFAASLFFDTPPVSTATARPSRASPTHADVGSYAGLGPAGTLHDLWGRNVRGDRLRAELHRYAAENHTVLGYNKVWDALESIDGGWDIYTGFHWPVGKHAGMRCGREHAAKGRKVGRCFNREHAWPKSWWGGMDKGGPASTDLFALFLVDEEANAQRSNLPLGLVTNSQALFTSPAGAKMGPCAGRAQSSIAAALPGQVAARSEQGKVKFWKAEKSFGFVVLADGREVFVHASNVDVPRPLRAGDKVSVQVRKNNKGLAGKHVQLLEAAPALCFEPPDSVKGDLARAYFYMSVRYMDTWKCCNNDAVSGSRLNPALELLLRQWHTQDPVSESEKERARRITQAWQHNSNPFIFFPSLVDRIEDF